jgi:hypothetical protein
MVTLPHRDPGLTAMHGAIDRCQLDVGHLSKRILYQSLPSGRKLATVVAERRKVFNEPEAVRNSLVEVVRREFENLDFGGFDGGCACYELGTSSKKCSRLEIHAEEKERR